MTTERAHALAGDDALLKLVDFKWLMAGVGWRVDLTRLQHDSAYTRQCLERALKSESALLRRHSIELLGMRRLAESRH